MKEVTKYAPPNSIVFVSDVDGEPPEHWDNELIHHSSSCVSVGCYPEIDGETELTLAPATEPVSGPEFELVFDGMIATPGRQVIISDIDAKRLLSTSVSGLETRIRVWVNDPKLPDKVVVGWG